MALDTIEDISRQFREKVIAFKSNVEACQDFLHPFADAIDDKKFVDAVDFAHEHDLQALKTLSEESQKALSKWDTFVALKDKIISKLPASKEVFEDAIEGFEDASDPQIIRDIPRPPEVFEDLKEYAEQVRGLQEQEANISGLVKRLKGNVAQKLDKVHDVVEAVEGGAQKVEDGAHHVKQKISEAVALAEEVRRCLPKLADKSATIAGCCFFHYWLKARSELSDCLKKLSLVEASGIKDMQEMCKKIATEPDNEQRDIQLDNVMLFAAAQRSLTLATIEQLEISKAHAEIAQLSSLALCGAATIAVLCRYSTGDLSFCISDVIRACGIVGGAAGSKISQKQLEDIGIAAGKAAEADDELVKLLTTLLKSWKHDRLEKFVEAFRADGPGGASKLELFIKDTALRLLTIGGMSVIVDTVVVLAYGRAGFLLVMVAGLPNAARGAAFAGGAVGALSFWPVVAMSCIDLAASAGAGRASGCLAPDVPGQRVAGAASLGAAAGSGAVLGSWAGPMGALGGAAVGTGIWASRNVGERLSQYWSQYATIWVTNQTSNTITVQSYNPDALILRVPYTTVVLEPGQHKKLASARGSRSHFSTMLSIDNGDYIGVMEANSPYAYIGSNTVQPFLKNVRGGHSALLVRNDRGADVKVQVYDATEGGTWVKGPSMTVCAKSLAIAKGVSNADGKMLLWCGNNDATPSQENGTEHSPMDGIVLITQDMSLQQGHFCGW